MCGGPRSRVAGLKTTMYAAVLALDEEWSSTYTVPNLGKLEVQVAALAPDYIELYEPPHTPLLLKYIAQRLSGRRVGVPRLTSLPPPRIVTPSHSRHLP
ncbi:uncharacterized protein LACBIDRAFT_299360 [Laccaria bicolor S238N-H82]|uniref:Predicted protein n=1 Tax=Laccaria bicolor (strain S238N-H82 / ATCC MYA-4686) TaxID=486041 RepID=B0DEK4_LACBS|nr:uncharacterized protein LACBIDRAFT_299360 [Laccaria bicolor S238N-H82]EDR07049.1 predicted protein [Laccaria bicolor S238N-H82]|eukprot:XP_001882422.1 predicted protein [Laccaria bicolor S238N-H82]